MLLSFLFAPRDSGECKRWMAPASHATRRLAATVNGPLMQQLAEEIEFWDLACVEMFRHGATLCLSIS